MSRICHRGSALTVAVLVAVTALAQAAAGPDDKDPPAQADEGKPLIVTVKEVKGSVERLVPGEKEQWVAVKAGEQLSELTILHTGLRSQATLQFADNSTVVVRRATKMGTPRFRKKAEVTETKLGLKYGAVRTEVERARGPNDFTVKSPVATLAITGSGGPVGYTGDMGFQTKCDHGSFQVLKGFQALGLTGGETTNNQMNKSGLIKKLAFTPQLGDVFGGTTKSEAKSLVMLGGGRGAIGFTGGGTGGRKVIKPPRVIPLRIIRFKALDIGLGN